MNFVSLRFRWMGVFSWVVALALTSCSSVHRHPSSVDGAQGTAPSAYDVLGVAPGVSPKALEEALQNILTDAAVSVEDKAKAAASFELLSNPELRAQYDQKPGQDVDLAAPPEMDLQTLEKLMLEVDPPAARRLRSTGKIAASTAGNMATFYFAMGVSEAWHCFKTKDPQYCRAYVDSLKEPSGHIGFVLFVGTSHLISAGGVKLLGDKIAMRSALGYLGMAGGSLASEIFSEFWSHPATKDYLAAFSIKDPVERDAKKKAARQKLWKDTFGNKEWAKDKVPGLLTLVAAAGASEVTTTVAKKVIAKFDTGSPCARAISKLLSLASPTLTSKITRRATKFGGELGGLLLFLQWDSILRQPIKRVWDVNTLESTIVQMMATLKQQAQQKADESVLAPMILELEKTWDHQRHNRMAQLDSILAAHLQEVNSFDQAAGRPFMFYSWMIHGMSDKAQELDALGKVSQAETDKFATAFFCGPSVEESFRDSSDLHGLPVPGRWSPKFVPYRVKPDLDSAFCSQIQSLSREDRIQKLKVEAQKTEYVDQARSAHARFVVMTQDIRLAVINRYESQLQSKLSSVMRDSSVGYSSLPMGVLKSFQTEYDFVQSVIAIRPESLALQHYRKDIVDKRQAALDLLKYMESTGDDHVPPQLDLDAMLSALEAGNGSEKTPSASVKQYFNGFIVR